VHVAEHILFGGSATLNWRELFMFRMLRLAKILQIDKLLRERTLRFIGRTYPFMDYFKILGKSEAVGRILGEKTEEILRNLKVEFTWLRGYMWLNSLSGHLIVSSYYMNTGDKVDIYLDLIHELVHVRQRMEGKRLFDDRYSYVERPTEVEAYRYAVEEARNLGLSDERICEYLKTEWISDEDLKQLSRNLDVKC
jgi:hypothetical protein